MDFPISDYLTRVGLRHKPAADLAGLRELCRAQAYAIAFENLDSLNGRPVALDPGALVEKLVRKQRGGYCFELSGLLRLALESCGFAVRPLLARVLFNKPEPDGRTHLALAVAVDGREWLVDIGFGGHSSIDPLPLAPGEYGLYRLQPGELGLVLQKRGAEGNWVDLYALCPAPVVAGDIEMGNHFTSTYPDSIFLKTLMVARHAPWGRATLLGNRLMVERDGIETVSELGTSEAVDEALREWFGIFWPNPVIP